MLGGEDAKAAQPWLLCLNLQREYVTAGRPLYACGAAAAATRARAYVSYARDSGWVVAHVRSGRSRFANSESFGRAIEGLEPLPSEPLFMTPRRSALAHPELRARLILEHPPAIYLVGFSLAHEALAVLFHATDLGLPLRLVEDAIASPAIGDRSGPEVDRIALAIAASLSGLATGAEVLRAGAGKIVSFRGA